MCVNLFLYLRVSKYDLSKFSLQGESSPSPIITSHRVTSTLTPFEETFPYPPPLKGVFSDVITRWSAYVRAVLFRLRRPLL